MQIKKLMAGISLAGLLLLGGCSNNKKADNSSNVKHVGVSRSTPFFRQSIQGL